jgi:hypothetical protein
VNFTNQFINQSLAREGARTGEFSTIDLKDASDRVSLSLVQEVFPARWVDALLASRSKETVLPGGQVVELQKFAPMGSSCCFPVEALVFWAIAAAATNMSRDIFVYGDDIICPVIFTEQIVRGLESFGLLVNADKSYYQGPFRESCGGDFYNGVEVTPIRLRKSFGKSHTARMSAIDFGNELITKFGEDSYSSLKLIEDVYGPVPRSELPIPGTFRMPRNSSTDAFFRRRWNKDLQRFEYRIPQLSIRPVMVREHGWNELLRKELSRGIPNHQVGDYRYKWYEPRNSIEPGVYVDPHSTHAKWGWAWLG